MNIKIMIERLSIKTDETAIDVNICMLMMMIKKMY